MYFIFSKLLVYLLYPLTWVFILFAFAAFTKQSKRRQNFFIASIVTLYLFSNFFLFSLFARHWDIPATLPHGTYNCAIVLGGFSGTDQYDRGQFGPAADRFIQGVKLYETGTVSHILITGGNGNLLAGSFREATWVKAQLKAFNIPDSAILIESNSKNTIENARFSDKVLKQSHLTGPYLLVTSAFHMRRSIMIFKKAGLNVIPYSSNFITGSKITFDDYFIPNSSALSNWNFYTKEVVGYIVNHFNG